MLNQEQLSILFSAARTHNDWLNKEVPDSLLKAIYEEMKWGATSANASPARLVFIKSPEQKQKLLACMSEGNQEKTKSAPVTVIIAMDMAFYDKLPKLFPHADARSWFAGNDAAIESTAFRNSSLQGAYMMLAARALGLDCGPMSGFDANKINADFFAGTDVKVNFVCNLGYGDAQKLFPRSPRLDFDEACQII